MRNVYVQTNEEENRVIAFRREDGGALTRLGDFPTGGAGDGHPHLTSQGSVVLAGDGRLLVANAASGDVSVFTTATDALHVVGTTASGGAPKSIAESTSSTPPTRATPASGSATPGSNRSRVRAATSPPGPTRRKSASHPTARRSWSRTAAQTR
jgi:hypothetical protein